MQIKVKWVAAAVVLGLASVAGATDAEARQFTVTMANMNFGRVPTDARVGDTIIWANDDSVEHTATARDGSFDLHILPGKRGRTVLTKKGKLTVICLMHPMMRTTLKVS